MSEPTQRFNHVAMSVPADLLDARGRAELLGFYGDHGRWRFLSGNTGEVPIGQLKNF